MTPSDTPPIPVIQSDRDAAADLHGAIYGTATPGYTWIRAGELDDDYAVQAFARHRIAAIEPLAEALEPFDEALGEDDADYTDDFPIRLKWGAHTYFGLKVGDLRRARTALAKIGGAS